MKIFKRIYYPVMAALLTLMLVLGFVDATVGSPKNHFNSDFFVNVNKHIEKIAEGSHNSLNPVNQTDARDYIKEQLSTNNKGKLSDVTKDNDGMDIVDFAVNGKVKVPTVAIQTTTLSENTISKMATLKEGEAFVNKEVSNIIAIIPGSDTLSKGNGKSIIMMANYDSAPTSSGASDNAIATAALIENFKNVIDSKKTYKNDLVFVFADAGQEGLAGAYAFKYQFKGFNDVYANAELGANFDSFGTSGTMTMFQSSNKNSKLIKEYAKVNGGTFTSSLLDSVFDNSKNVSEFNVFGDMMSLNFANFGGTDKHNTALDNVKNVSQAVVKGQSNAVYNFYNHFGNMQLSDLSSNSNAVYFSYLDMFTVVYPLAVSFVIGGLIVGLFVAIILLNKRNKSFSWAKVGGGVAVQILTVAATILTMFVFYFIVALFMSLFGVIPVAAITSLTYSGVGLMVSMLVLAMAAAFTFYILLKKAFNVKAADVVRGNAVLLGIVGIVLSFIPALQAASYVVSIFAMLSLVVTLVTTILKNSFKKKFGMDMERLFLYVFPLIICLPIILPPMMMTSMVVSAMYLPVIAGMFVVMFGAIAPYFDYLKPTFNAVAEKLPLRTIRVERQVTERVEDKAKKGKFTTVTSKKVTNEKIKWRYLNRFGISVIAVLSFVSIMLFTSFGGTFSQGIAGTMAFSDSIYDDALVYVWDKTSGSATEQLVIKDFLAYKYFSRSVKDFKWNAKTKAYEKDYTATSHIANAPTVTKEGSTYTFNVYDKTRSSVTLKLSGVSSVTKFTFSGSKGAPMTFANKDLNERTFFLPYGFGNITMVVEGGSAIDIEYTENSMGKESIYGIPEFEKILQDNAGEEIYDSIRGGIVLKYKETK